MADIKSSPFLTELPFHGKVSGSASEPTIDILYQLGVTQDEGTSER